MEEVLNTFIIIVQIIVWSTVVIVDLALIWEIHHLRTDMKTTNDALVSIVKTGIVVNAVLALLQSAAQRRKPGEDYGR
jgi:hypothetical protein